MEALDSNPPIYPATRFAVISDMHLYDNDLGTEGEAWQEYLSQDRKLVEESEEILDAAIMRITSEDVDFILVCGDMTKDGELICHQMAAEYLDELEAKGKPVYVIPGNHDVFNADAERYIGDKTEPVDNISPDKFRGIYSEFGYGDAKDMDKDPGSLSYVFEPVVGLWILALDSCTYGDEAAKPITEGAIRQETINWLQEVLDRSVREEKAVIAMMHHQLMVHYPAQGKEFPENIVKNAEEIAHLLAQYHVHLVFTGHDHAQDITAATWESGEDFLFDIGTGSLVTYPSPYRVVEITGDQQCNLTSRFIDSTSGHPEDFDDYVREVSAERITEVAVNRLRDYLVSEKSARIIAPQFTRAFLAHYIGDEPAPGELLNTDGISLWAKIITSMKKKVYYGLWQDLDPPDNFLTIDLKTGQWK